MTAFEVKAIGRVESPLTDPGAAPGQADEGAPAAWLVFDPGVLDGLRSIRPGDEVIVLTWLDRARRDVLVVHQHRAEITAVDGRRLQVRALEVLDGTPIIDVKPVLSGAIDQR